MRYLKDLNNQFHAGSAISFVELVSAITEVDEAAATGVPVCPVVAARCVP